MTTQRIGRFQLSPPPEMRRTSQRHTLRFCEIEEFPLPAGPDREDAVKAAWMKRLAAIEAMRRPEGVSRLLIETRDASRTGLKTRSVLYYGNELTDQEIYWDVLLDAGGGTGIQGPHGRHLVGDRALHRWQART